MSLQIRQASAADVAAILGLLAQLDVVGEPEMTLAEGRRILERIAMYPNYAVYVAEASDGRIVGTFSLLVMDSLAHRGAPSAIVENVCVDATTRRQGVGRALMAFAMGLAKQHGCYKLALSSNTGRPDAHEFYRSLGFSQHGISFQVHLERPAAR